MTVTGRWVLSLFGLKSNVFAETFLGLLVWMLAICVSIALFRSTRLITEASLRRASRSAAAGPVLAGTSVLPISMGSRLPLLAGWVDVRMAGPRGRNPAEPLLS